MNLELFDLARLEGQWAPRICLSLAPQNCDYRYTPPHLAFMGVMDIKLMVVQQILYQQFNHLSSFSLAFYSLCEKYRK